jgi:hypothetical protein
METKLEILREGSNILVRGVQNGGRIPLALLGITVSSEIKRLWTILREEDIYVAYDSQTGAKVAVPLKDARPKHWQNAFVEDRMHDWFIHAGELRYEAHSTEPGAVVTILIELTPEQLHQDGAHLPD